jgi:nucleotide-binding universal stress UspA family protein
MAQVKSILVPSDFSAPSDLATDYAIDMAFRYGASIRLLHVIEEPAIYPDGYVDLPGLQQHLVNEATNRLAALAAKCETARVDVTSAIVTGRPATVIVEEASARDVDLIVMGTHGRTGLAHLFLGSVAERVVRTASCPVLSVRENARVQATLVADAEARKQPLPVLVQ